jgi:hypothetical protein
VTGKAIEHISLGIHPKTLKRARGKGGIVISKAGKDAGWMWHYRFTLT